MPVQGNPTQPLVAGNSVRNPTLSNYVFQSGIHKPEHSNILSYKYPQYYATALLERIGAYEGIGQDVWSWNILDRTREGGTVSSLTAVGSTTITFEVTEFDLTSTNLGYLIVGDVIRTQAGTLGRVTASVVSTVLTAKQKVTVAKVGGGNWAATDIADAEEFGHVYNIFPEASDAPNGRLYLPVEEYNRLTILRRSFNISGSEFTNRTYLGDGESWYFTIEDIEMKEFARDREGLVLFGDRDDGTHQSSRGILDYALTDGINTGFVGATGVAESDLQDHIEKMVIEGTSNEVTVLCGARFLKDVQVALRDYALDGAIAYGTLGANMAGLDFQSYRFMGKTIHFAFYELFNDGAMVPFDGTASSDDINFSNFSLWLDLGTDQGGQNLITLKYKDLDGQSRKFIHAYEVGMMNPEGMNGGFVANGKDAFTIHYLSEIGIEVRLPNRLGILRATS